MFKNTASQKLTVFCFDSTTNLPKTGDAANLTAYRDIDDGGVTVLTDTSATEKDATNAKGFYIFDLTQAETNGDKIMFSCKSSTANIVCIAVPAVVYTAPANFTSLVIDTTGRVNAFLIGILTTVFTEGAAGRIAAAFKQFFNVATPTSTMNQITLVDTVTTTTTATNLTNAPTSGDLTATMKTSVQTAATASIVAFFGADAATFIASIWNALTSGMTTVGSIGKKLADWVVGTIDTYTGNTKQTGDAYARLGAPAGASIAADIAAIPAAVGALVVHTGITLIQSLRMIGAMVAGKTTGAGTGTVTFRNPIDTLDAVIVTMTGLNRTAVTKDLSA